MSFKNLGKLFKLSKSNKRSESQEIEIPIDGFEQCIQLLLIHSGQEIINGESSIGIVTSGSGKNNINPHGMAVLRYLGRCHGLAGADPFEDLEIDQIVDVFHDFLHDVASLDCEEDLNLKEDRIAKFIKTKGLTNLNKFDAVISANKGHLALSKLTWADFLVTGMWDYIVNVLKVDEQKYPNISNMVKIITSANQPTK